MAGTSGPFIATDGLVFDYDMSNTKKSFIGPPATNRIISIPLTLTVYAYATGPVSTTNIIDATYQPRTVSRYTISNNINTARAMVTSSGLTTGVSYTFSCKIKYNGANTATPSFAVDASKGNPEGGSNNNTVSSSVGATTSLGNGWYYVTYTWSYSACPTSGCYLTYGVVTGADATYVGNTFDVYEPQFEIGSFATPYVTQSTGIRSTSQALLDLTGKNVTTATSLTYVSDGTFSYNGTSDYLEVTQLSSYLSNSITVCTFAKISSVVSKNNLLSLNGVYNFFLPGNRLTTTYQLYWDSAGGWKNGNNTDWVTNQWYHLAWTISGTTLIFYVNGVADGTVTLAGNIAPSGTSRLGLANAGEYATGSIGTVQVYNRALLATEIQQNFNAQRTRYGI